MAKQQCVEVVPDGDRLKRLKVGAWLPAAPMLLALLLAFLNVALGLVAFLK